MSAIASFILLPKSALPELRKAAVPKKRFFFFGALKYRFRDFLRTRGREVASYDWSGYVIATVLPYLEERGIDLMKSEYDELSSHLSKAQQSTCFILTPAHQQAYLARLSPELYAEAELRDYANEFNGSSEAGAGKPMLDGIRAIRDSLRQLDDDSVILIHIG
jgi:hypothetical protein